MKISNDIEQKTATFSEAYQRSQAIWQDIPTNPDKYRVLTGERPTGPLHIGHLFGTIANRVRIQSMGTTIFIVIADYQVLTDRNTVNVIDANVREMMLDYLASGLDPNNGRTHFFIHSHVPELNQLLLPFMSLVTTSELSRNPTVKEEIKSAGLAYINTLTYTYPIHQAADILFCKGNIVPVGKDQLPHLELTRKISRRFNERFPSNPSVFPTPSALLSDIPNVLGTDGQKMSKSRNNAILLKMTADETTKIIKGAKTDSNRDIYYDPNDRPEVSNLIKLISICTNENVQSIVDRIGSGGGGRLKTELTTALNDYLAPMRHARILLAKDQTYINDILYRGIAKAREIGIKTLKEVRKAMNMDYGLD